MQENIKIFINKIKLLNYYITDSKIDIQENKYYYVLQNSFSKENNNVKITINKTENNTYIVSIVKSDNQTRFNKEYSDINNISRRIFNDFDFIRIMMKNQFIPIENRRNYMDIINSKNNDVIKKWNKIISKNSNFMFIKGYLKDNKTIVKTNLSNKYLLSVEDEDYTIYENYLDMLKKYGQNYDKISSIFYKNQFEIILKK